MIVYDKAKWHFQHESFPSDLSEQNAFTHLGFFWDWTIQRNLLNIDFENEFKNELTLYKQKIYNGLKIATILDGALDEEMLKPEVNKFCEYFYHHNTQYYDFLLTIFPSYKEIYYIPYSEKNSSLVTRELNITYEKWKES